MLEKIIEVVQNCGDIILTATDVEDSVRSKEGKGNFVTTFDKKVQNALQFELIKLIPDALFVGEEDEVHNTNICQGYAFVVDPIDGTTNFFRGIEQSCISVALLKDGKPEIGVVYQPYTKETYYAQKGKGAFLNRKLISASDKTLDEGLFFFGACPYYTEYLQKSFDLGLQLMKIAQDFRRSGSAALDLCMIASGKGELFFEHMLNPWDFAAAALIIEEAGGFIKTVEGKDVVYDKIQNIVAYGKAVKYPL